MSVCNWSKRTQGLWGLEAIPGCFPVGDWMDEEVTDWVERDEGYGERQKTEGL